MSAFHISGKKLQVEGTNTKSERGGQGLGGMFSQSSGCTVSMRVCAPSQELG